MSKELLDLKDQLDELESELLLASEYARAVIEKETQLGKRTEQGFASITDRFFGKLKELWAFLGEVEKGRNYKPLEADLIGFCSHKNCAYDNGPVVEYNHCLDCPSRYTKDANGNLRDKNGEIIPVDPEAVAKEDRPILKFGEPVGG
jgi:hypothetical protein